MVVIFMTIILVGAGEKPGAAVGITTTVIGISTVCTTV